MNAGIQDATNLGWKLAFAAAARTLADEAHAAADAVLLRARAEQDERERRQRRQDFTRGVLTSALINMALSGGRGWGGGCRGGPRFPPRGPTGGGPFGGGGSTGLGGSRGGGGSSR